MVVQRCDTAEAVHVRLFVALGLRLRATGVWHAAGVLADGLLPKQTAAALSCVYAPKAHGTWTLQRMGAAVPQRRCVVFSSVAALLGGAGQANYSAANACLDALAALRRACSQTGVSVQWGAWAELGMAARGAAAERLAAMEASSGFSRIGLALGLRALHIAVQPRTPACIGVVPVQWHRILGGGTAPAFLSHMLPRAVQRTSVAGVDQAGCSVSLEVVLAMAQRTAGGTIDADAPLMEAGVDSLGAVELRNQLQHAVGEGVVLSSTLMFDHPTARQVAMHLLGSRPLAVGAQRGVGGACASRGAEVEVAGVGVALPVGVSGVAAVRLASHCGRDLLRVIPSSRWDVEQAAADLHGSPPEVASRVRHGAFLVGAQLFEHGFFSISAAEALAMDPQQRQLLERGYMALHAARMTKDALLGAVVAVNVGQW